ncbi:MAG: antibiotic biosynthesis monooxygenase [Nitrososphaera sp.]|nr:antibiotic biosynthesis monooxygenase [Nitrososphaera sp.]
MRRTDAKHMPLHHDNNDRKVNDGPVTVIVTRKAKKGKIDEFEEWMDGIIHEAMKFDGHMGVNVIRPSDTLGNPEYVIIFRFNTYENLRKWENSPIRKEWVDKSKDVTEGEPVVEKQTGLEFWFTPRSGTERTGGNTDSAPLTPPRYKMAIVITGIIFVLVSALLPQIRQATIGLPVPLSTLVGVVVMVVLMTYVVMPAVTRLLRPWLSKKRLF